MKPVIAIMFLVVCAVTASGTRPKQIGVQPVIVKGWHPNAHLTKEGYVTVPLVLSLQTASLARRDATTFDDWSRKDISDY